MFHLEFDRGNSFHFLNTFFLIEKKEMIAFERYV